MQFAAFAGAKLFASQGAHTRSAAKLQADCGALPAAQPAVQGVHGLEPEALQLVPLTQLSCVTQARCDGSHTKPLAQEQLVCPGSVPAR